MRLTLESCSMICVGTLQKTFKENILRDFPDLNEIGKFEKMQEELKKFTVNDQTFNYTFMKNRFGGHRWFFLCPKCNGRSTKLFLPPEWATGREPKYYCKYCHKLKNQSAIQGQSRIYKYVTKPLKRLKEIEKKLENGYLGSKKVKALLDEYEAIEAEMKTSPDYRLYLFKHRRGLIE